MDPPIWNIIGGVPLSGDSGAICEVAYNPCYGTPVTTCARTQADTDTVRCEDLTVPERVRALAVTIRVRW